LYGFGWVDASVFTFFRGVGTVSWTLYLLLSAMMFLQFAVWGAWMPVLAPRLLGPLKMTGKQTGWIFATLPLACIFAPLIAGQVADRYLNTEWVLAGAHLLGAILLFAAAKQERFAPMFVVMFLYSCCYAATLPLVNSLMFFQLGKVVTAPEAVAAESGKIFLMAPIGWALVGYFLTGWRQMTKTEGGAPDGFILAAILSLAMAAVCVFLPATPPAPAVADQSVAFGEMPIIKALALLQNFDFLMFVVISMVVAGMMQFYFMGTGPFMQDIGISGRNVSGLMGIAQAAQAIATLFALGPLTNAIGFKWTLVIGAGCWFVLYVVYVFSPQRALVIAAQALHGIAYVTFLIAGQIFAGQFAPVEIGGSVQALIFTATTGIGLFFGTQLAGFVMDRCSVEGRFQWKPLWSVPMWIMAGGVLALIIAFQGTLPVR
jgi:MFS family permease